MPSRSDAHTVRGIDYASTFWFTEIFRSFRIATQPGKMGLALLLVIAVFISSLLLDGLFGGRSVVPGEFQRFATQSAEDYDDWREMEMQSVRRRLAIIAASYSDQSRQATIEHYAEVSSPFREARKAVNDHFDGRIEDLKERQADETPDASDPEAAKAIEEEYAAARSVIEDQRHTNLTRINDLASTGIFREVIDIKINAFARLITAATELNPGWDQLNPARDLERAQFNEDLTPTIIGSLRVVLYEMPTWMWHSHRGFMVVSMLLFLGIWSLFGGSISRMCVVEVATDERESAFAAFAFSRKRWLQYALAPAIPMILIGIFALLLAAIGLLYHVPVLDILAGVLFALAIPVGFAMAFFLIGWVGAVHLMYPAISAEGTDAFDSLSRSYGYVLNRPWRFLLYTFVSLIYGAATYLFVGLFVFTALYLAQGATAIWSGRFDQIMSQPRVGDLTYNLDFSELTATEKVTAVIVFVWVHLAVGLVAAYALSYYFSCYSTIYMLLRRRCDGVSITEVYNEADDKSEGPGDKIEPGSTPPVNEPAPLSQADAE